MTSASRKRWLTAIVSALLLGAAAIPAAHAVNITTYGAGLESCHAYLDARGSDNADQVPFIDWLSGYFSGVNKTSTHRNNFFGLADLNRALNWLDAYCGARPKVHFAEAVGVLLLGGKPGPAAHTIEVTNYGSADKSCEVYHEARDQQEVQYWSEYVDWLGGYLSGVNAISLSTNNILGNSQLSQAVDWLDHYCGAHPQAAFGAAVDALVDANRPTKSQVASRQ